MSTAMIALPEGRLRGKKVVSVLNGSYFYSFKGIPYAKPPVGNLRFKPPQAPNYWIGVRDAFNEGNVAPQQNIRDQKYIGSEDCLFLNVYTPSLSLTTAKPVLVFIHGGGMHYGSGNSDVHGPDYFLTKDMLVVTINYRLGALGLISLDGTDSMPNNGLRDQIFALKWVQRNIEKFGGDPNCVTLCGHSSGAVNVHQLILSPAAKGLFHRAICMSGVSLSYCSYVSLDRLHKSVLCLAKAVKCPSNSPQEIINFLRTMPAKEIVHHQIKIHKEQEDRYFDPSFMVCVEPPGPNSVLPGFPHQLIKDKNFNHVPLIAGSTTGDGKIALVDITDLSDLKNLDKNFDFFVPTNLVEERSTEKCHEVVERMRQFYFDGKSISEETTVNYVNLANDTLYAHPLHRLITLLHGIEDAPPLYVYQFDHKKSGGDIFLSQDIRDLPGAAHCDDLFYLFKPAFIRGIKMSAADIKVSSKMINLWTQFMKTGSPNSSDSKIYWPPTKKEKNAYLIIAEELEVKENFLKDRMEFLDKLYKEYQPEDF